MHATVVHLTLKSANEKTGPIPVSTSTAAWCPSTCPLKEKGCYSASGPLALHWGAVTRGERGTGWVTFCAQISALPEGQIWRHNQAGDLPADAAGRINVSKLARLVDANKGRRGFTYTHHNMGREVNRDLVQFANRSGFTINLSANNPAHADKLAALGIGPVVTLLPIDAPRTSETPQGRRIVVCPATYRDDVTCASCALCARSDRRVIIGFPAHGSARRAADTIARMEG